MRFVVLLYEDTDATAAMTPAERHAIVEQHVAYAARLRERGAHVLGEPLSGPEAARTIRFDDGAAIVTDGPFLEAKEALGGIYVIDCTSLDEAVDLARAVPRSPGLVAEVRPVPAV